MLQQTNNDWPRGKLGRSICPERFKITSPRVSIDRGTAEVNRNSWGGDPESLGANRSGPVIICLIF